MEILCNQNSILLNSKQYGTDIEFYRIKKILKTHMNRHLYNKNGAIQRKKGSDIK